MRVIKFSRRTTKGESVLHTGLANAWATNQATSVLLFASFGMQDQQARAVTHWVSSQDPLSVSCDGFGSGLLHTAGYRVGVTKLPKYKTSHVVIAADEPRLIFGELGVALVRYLRSSAISTPFLDEWVPAMLELMNRKAMISKVLGFGCPVHVANFDSKEVDSVVSELIVKRKVRI